MPRCAARKPDGSPCERIVGAQQRYCYAHDPTTAEQRRRNAAKGGRGKPNKELAAVKERLRKLAEQVLDGEVDRDDAGVAARIYGVYLRAVEQERKVREQEEVLVRLERIEQERRRSKTAGIEDRLRRLEAANPDLCEQRPCKGPVAMTQKRLMPDGTVEVSGEPPPPLCDACPERGNTEVVRHIEVRYGFPPGGDIWEVDTDESAAREGEGKVRIRVVYDD